MPWQGVQLRLTTVWLVTYGTNGEKEPNPYKNPESGTLQTPRALEVALTRPATPFLGPGIHRTPADRPRKPVGASTLARSLGHQGAGGRKGEIEITVCD
jgi:hypothetical protein